MEQQLSSTTHATTITGMASRFGLLGVRMLLTTYATTITGTASIFGLLGVRMLPTTYATLTSMVSV